MLRKVLRLLFDPRSIGDHAPDAILTRRRLGAGGVLENTRWILTLSPRWRRVIVTAILGSIVVGILTKVMPILKLALLVNAG